LGNPGFVLPFLYFNLTPHCGNVVGRMNREKEKSLKAEITKGEMTTFRDTTVS
jgi:hypothetical protein